jgi:glycosyltransferase involved in cell wall biosynthesis
LKEVPKIRLFVDAHCFDKEHQGTRAYIKRIYTEFSKKNPQVELYFGASNIENLKSELGSIQNCRFIKYRFPYTITRLLIETPLLILRHRIDLAHFQYIIPFIRNCRYIVTTHDALFNDFKEEFSAFYRLSRNFLFRYSIRHSDIITTVSEYSRASIHKYFKANPSEIYVTPNGVSSDFFENFDKNLSKNYIKEKFGITRYLLYVSRFEPRKNHSLLLRAYLDLQLYLKGYFLVLLGHVSIKEPEFDAILNQLPDDIRQFIFISATVNDQDLYHFYRGTEVFIYPSKAEGFGLPPIEAGALKIPVICSNATAMSDFTFFGEYHLDPADYGLFVQKLNQIICNPANEIQLAKISDEIAKRYLFNNAAETLREAILNKFF